MGAEDLGDYYRVPSDKRDLNYEKYFTEGHEKLKIQEEYNSNNTHILNVAEIKEKLLALPFIQRELREWGER